MRLPLLAALGVVTTLGIAMFAAPDVSAQTRRATVVSSARGTAIVSRPLRTRSAMVVRRGARGAVVTRGPRGARGAIIMRRR